MPKYSHPDVLDNGPNFIKNNCDKLVLIDAYTFGDSYATVTGGSNILAEVNMTSTDFTNGTSGNNRTLTSASGKQDASANANGTGADNHFAFLDTVNSKVLWVTNETSAQAITSGNPITFPSLVYTSNQLT
jgi:hypothetical protein